MRIRKQSIARARHRGVIVRGLMMAAVFAAVIVSVIVSSQGVSAGSDKTQYRSKSSCISGSGAPEVPAIIDACDRCFDRDTYSRQAALWFNDDSRDKSSNLITLRYKNKKPPTTATFYMWGQTFGCRNPNTGMTYASNIHLYEPGTTNDVNYLTLNRNPNFATKLGVVMARGATAGIWTWSDGHKMKGTLKVSEFMKKADCVGSSTLVDPNDPTPHVQKTVKTCKATIDVWRCFYTKSQSEGINCGPDPSTIKVKVIEEIEPEPEEEDTPQPSHSDEFWSTSTLSVPQQNGDVSGHKIVTRSDDNGALKLSTDAPSLRVEFWHTLHFTPYDYPPEDRLEGTPFTEYQIYNEGSRRVAGPTTWRTSAGREAVRDNINRETVTINLQPGETKTVCRRIRYADKYMNFKWKDEVTMGDGHGGQIHLYDIYTLHNGHHESDEYSTWWVNDYDPDWNTSGGGGSKVCVTVTRPKDPTTVNPGAATQVGFPGSDVVYEGESTPMSWNVRANGVDVRRLVSAQPLVYMHSVEQNYFPELMQGEPRYRQDGAEACDFFLYDKDATDCSEPNYNSLMQIIPGVKQYFSSNIASGAKVVSSPDMLGWKYCNSYAYRFEYWYSVTMGTAEVWKHEPDYDYWYVFNSSCKSIAKKPSTAIWNGNFMTAGGVDTSLSYRFDNPVMAVEANSWVLGERRLYGSWTEFLLAAGNTVDGMGSGAALSLGSTRSGDQICESDLAHSNSPLTIADQSCAVLGYSGIGNNSTINARMDSYLRNQAQGSELRDLGSEAGGTIFVNGTRIIEHNGDLTIDRNIIVPTGPYNSIYDLPQAVIFVNGNVNITSNVTQIDAWIIARGELNTCRDFSAGNTGAIAPGYTDIYYNDGDVCQNQLVFNAPVYANRVRLNRSYGSDPLVPAGSSRMAAGEIFNLRADTYLWAYAQSGRYDSSYTESYSRELAPRY